MKNKNGGRLVIAAWMTLLLRITLADSWAGEPVVVPQPGSESVNVELFQGVKILKTPSSNVYPFEEEHSSQEGWVVLSMMIDPRGKPYEVSVVDSTGSPAFEKAAIRSLNQMSFAPATRGSTPIDSSFEFKMRFYQSYPARGARGEFVTAYRKLIGAVEANDKEKADEQLAKVRVQNLYEEAFFNVGKFFYDRRWGSEAEQLRDLRRAVAREKSDHYLPKKVFIAALVSTFTLELKTNDFGSALETWQTLEPLAPEDLRDQFQ